MFSESVSEPNRPRVLIGDDCQPLLDRLVALLGREFTVVGAFTDGAQLVEAEARLRPDVLLIDISMPGMSGLEAMRLIRRRGSRTPVVCLSAHEDLDVLDAASTAGALGYVTKRCLCHDLVPALRAALQGQRFASPSVEAEAGATSAGADAR